MACGRGRNSETRIKRRNVGVNPLDTTTRAAELGSPSQAPEKGEGAVSSVKCRKQQPWNPVPSPSTPSFSGPKEGDSHDGDICPRGVWRATESH